MGADTESFGCPRTVNELWQGALRAHRAKPCIGIASAKNNFEFMSFKEMNYHVECRRCTLSQLAKGRRVGIWGAKCPAWMVSILGCAGAGVPYVPIPQNMPSYAVDQVVETSGMFLMFASESDLIQVAKTLQRTTHNIEFVVYWGRDLPYYSEELQELRKAKMTVYHFGELLEMGELLKDLVATEVGPESELAVIYREGEKGQICGDQFTHRFIVEKVVSYRDHFPGRDIISDDVAFSCLALDKSSHLIAELFLLHSGVRIGYNSHKSNSLVADTQLLQPTLVFSSSKGLADICHQLDGTGQQGPKMLTGLNRAFFWWGCRRKLAFMRQGVDRSNATPMIDALVFRKARHLLGGRQRIIASIGQDMEPGNMELLELSMCCTVYQISAILPLGLAAMPCSFNKSSKQKMQGVRSFLSWASNLSNKSREEIGAAAQDDDACSLQGSGLESLSSFKSTQSDSDCPSEKESSSNYGAQSQLDEPSQAMCKYVEGIYKKSSYIRGISIHQHDEKESLTAMIIPNNRRLARLKRIKKIDSCTRKGIENAVMMEAILEDLQVMGKKAGLRQFEMVETVSLKD